MYGGLSVFHLLCPSTFPIYRLLVVVLPQLDSIVVLVASAGGGIDDNNGDLCKFLADFVVLASSGEARRNIASQLDNHYIL